MLGTIHVEHRDSHSCIVPALLIILFSPLMFLIVWSVLLFILYPMPVMISVYFEQSSVDHRRTMQASRLSSFDHIHFSDSWQAES